MTSGLTLPDHIEIHHKFLTISPQLRLVSKTGDDLFRVDFPSLRLRKTAFIYRAGDVKDWLVRIDPVAGLTRDVKVTNLKDDILGVVQREKDEKTGRAIWIFVDSTGRQDLAVKQEGSVAQRIRRHLSLFSSLYQNLYAGDKYIGSFITHSGWVHENYLVNLDPESGVVVDPLVLLATVTTLTGILHRVFT